MNNQISNIPLASCFSTELILIFIKNELQIPNNSSIDSKYAYHFVISQDH